MKKVLNTLAIIFVTSLALAQTPTENYIKSTTYRIETTTGNVSNSDKNEFITYFDGLGRPMQAIGNRAGGNGEDIITPILYDEYGRQEKDYLPYSSSANIGTFRTDALSANNIYYDATKYDSDFPSVSVNNINAYSQKELEASPLNRILKQAAPGKDWKLGNGHEIEFDYQTNSATEVRHYEVSLNKTTNNSVITYIPTLVLDTSVNNNYGYYQANSLYKTITKDENHDGTSSKNHTTQEFKDKQGRVVLKRTYADTDLNDDGDTSEIGETEVPHDTYYVYDKFGNLSYVLPPKAEAHTDIPSNSGQYSELAELCYQYRYDEKNRLIRKVIPGGSVELIVYNHLDEPIMTQDYHSWSDLGWNFTKYDAYGRVAYTGQYNRYSMSLDYWHITYQNNANSASINYVTKLTSNPIDLGDTTVYYTDDAYPNNLGNSDRLLTINYYDDYNFDIGSGTPETAGGITPITNPKGLPTGNKVRVLGTNQWINTVIYYDKQSRPIYIYTYNEYLGITDKVKHEYDFTGNILKSTTTHARSGGHNTITTVDTYSYDNLGRLTSHKQKINAQQEELIVLNSYDKLGQLENKKVGGNVSTQIENSIGLQTVNYDYNIRGWLKQINEPTGLGNDLFAFKIGYNEGANPLFNGNISSTQWKTANTDGSLKTYEYQYDALNRITSAIDNLDRYSLSNVLYDKNGNIKRLKRKGHVVAQPVSTNSTHFGVMDDLIYTYQTTSNKLLKVEDIAPVDAFGYKDDAVNLEPDSHNDYSYNGGGGLEFDETKTLLFWKYNHLGLPEEVMNYSNVGNISYIYDANGTKIKKVVSTGVTLDYAGNYIYEDTGLGSSLKFFNHAEGYVDAENGYKYVYQYKDHLGNVRLSYQDIDGNGSISAPTEILEENNYYPFGLKHKGYNNVINGTDHPYGFGGKEEQDELGLVWIDIDARNYDASIGRWFNLDPLAEAMTRHSPYNYAFNNPIYFIDPDGNMPFSFDENNDDDQNIFKYEGNELRSTVVDNTGKIIDHKDDGDDNIYLNTRSLNNVIGTEREGIDYTVGNSISREDLNEGYSLVNLREGGTFIARDIYIGDTQTILEVPWYLGGGGAWKTGRLLGFFSRLKVLWNGGTVKITVQILGNVEKTSNLAKVLKTLEAEAKSAGAKKVIIEGIDIANKKLLNVKLFERFGYTVEKVTETTVSIVKNLK